MTEYFDSWLDSFVLHIEKIRQIVTGTNKRFQHAYQHFNEPWQVSCISTLYSYALWDIIMSSNGNIFHVTGPLWGESTGHRWIPLTKASGVELWCFLWSVPEQTVSKQSRWYWFETPSCLLWHHCNVSYTALQWYPNERDGVSNAISSVT